MVPVRADSALSKTQKRERDRRYNAKKVVKQKRSEYNRRYQQRKKNAEALNEPMRNEATQISVYYYNENLYIDEDDMNERFHEESSSYNDSDGGLLNDLNFNTDSYDVDMESQSSDQLNSNRTDYFDQEFTDSLNTYNNGS